MPDALFEQADNGTAMKDITQTDFLLLKARANRFINQIPKKLSFEHGRLPENIDIFIAFGLLRHQHISDDQLATFHTQVFTAFSQCLHICMENNRSLLDESCDVCETITDLAVHSVGCFDDPRVCSTCRSFLNIIEYHMNNCETCDMHLCTKLRLKLMKYNWNLETGLLKLWPKIQRYVSSLFPGKYNPQSRPPVPVPRGQNSMNAMAEAETVLARGPGDSGGGGFGVVGDARGLYDGSSAGAVGGDILTMTPQIDQLGYMGYQQSHCGDMDHISSFQCHTSPFQSAQSYTSSPYSSGHRLKEHVGYGCIIHGEPRHLKQLSAKWEEMKLFLLSEPTGELPQAPDGVILDGKDSQMKVVNNRYEKNKEWQKITFIGRGVAGKCYLAVDKTTEARFVVKKVQMRDFERDELDLWSELEHPNLVQLFGAMRVKKKIYIFCELYTSGSMLEFIQNSKMLDQYISLHFLSQLLDALAYLDSKGILHEDIKADNIFLNTESYRIGLGDFGLSRRGNCPKNVKPVGGMHQWSPEKASSCGHGTTADVWAVNCTFVHMLSGHPVWTRKYPEVQLLHWIIAKESPPIDDIPPNLITLVDTLIRRAWTLDPDARPSADQLRDDDCFKLLQEDPYAPEFRSHIDYLEEQEALEMAAQFPSEGSDQFSIDSILRNMENPREAEDYLEEVMESIRTEPEGSLKLDHGLDCIEEEGMDFDEQISHARDRRPQLNPLIIPDPCKVPRRNPIERSMTSPHEGPNCWREGRLPSLNKQASSPAIILSGPPEDIQLTGDIDIRDLRKGDVSSGYGTGLPDPEEDLSINVNSLKIQSPSSVDLSGNMSCEPGTSVYTPSFPTNTGFESSSMSGTPMTQDAHLSCLQLDSLKQSGLFGEPISGPPMVTVYNEMAQLDCIEIVIGKEESWLDLVRRCLDELTKLKLESYTLKTENDEDIYLDETVPYRTATLKAVAPREKSAWYVENGRIQYRDRRL